jgi:ribosomal protein S11
MQVLRKKKNMKKKNFKFIKNNSKDKTLRFWGSILIYRQTYSNFFLTLVDRTSKVICCITSGNSHVGDSVRQKRSAYAMEKLCEKLVKTLKLYKLKFLVIYLYTNPTSAFFSLVQELKRHQISVLGICDFVRTPHNGLRQRNPRRV